MTAPSHASAAAIRLNSGVVTPFAGSARKEEFRVFETQVTGSILHLRIEPVRGAMPRAETPS